MYGKAQEDFKDAVDHKLTDIFLTVEDFPTAISAVSFLVDFHSGLKDFFSNTKSVEITDEG